MIEHPSRDVWEEDAARGAGHSPNADNGSNGCFREHVRSCCKQVCRPSLVGRSSQSDEQDCGPIAYPGNGQDWQDTQRKDEHAGLASASNGPASSNEIAGEPAAKDTQYRYDSIDGDEMEPALLDLKATGLLEKIGQPNEKKPPNRVS